MKDNRETTPNLGFDIDEVKEYKMIKDKFIGTNEWMDDATTIRYRELRKKFEGLDLFQMLLDALYQTKVFSVIAEGESVKCPMCKSETEIKTEPFDSEILGHYRKCKNSECDFSWLPTEEENKIDLALAKRRIQELTTENERLKSEVNEYQAQIKQVEQFTSGQMYKLREDLTLATDALEKLVSRVDEYAESGNIFCFNYHKETDDEPGSLSECLEDARETLAKLKERK